jgi:hypothetical protein
VPINGSTLDDRGYSLVMISGISFLGASTKLRYFHQTPPMKSTINKKNDPKIPKNIFRNRIIKRFFIIDDSR